QPPHPVLSPEERGSGVTFREKAEVLDQAGLDRALTRIGHEIVEQAGGAHLPPGGIKTRGEAPAPRIAPEIAGDASQPPAGGGPSTSPSTGTTWVPASSSRRCAARRSPSLSRASPSSSWTTCSSRGGPSGRPWTPSWISDGPA